MDAKTILIVDDEEDVQALLKKRLEHEGFHCVSCLSVEDALERIKDIQPSLVILDLGFRKASGIAFLQNMTSHLEASKRPPVMVLSAYNDPDIVDYTRSLGAKSFVSKPFETSHLLRTIEEALQ